jgi:hypothetical protein
MLPETPTTDETVPPPLVELSSLTLEGLTRFLTIVRCVSSRSMRGAGECRTDRLQRSLECARELALGPMPGHMLR